MRGQGKRKGQGREWCERSGEEDGVRGQEKRMV